MKTSQTIKDILKEIRSVYGINAKVAYNIRQATKIYDNDEMSVVAVNMGEGKTYIMYPVSTDWGKTVFNISNKHADNVQWEGNVYECIRVYE